MPIDGACLGVLNRRTWKAWFTRFITTVSKVCPDSFFISNTTKKSSKSTFPSGMRIVSMYRIMILGTLAATGTSVVGSRSRGARAATDAPT